MRAPQTYRFYNSAIYILKVQLLVLILIFALYSFSFAGTSTRKPRLNSALVAQQAATLPGASGTMPNGTKSASGSRHGAGHEKSKHKKYPARLKNVDRSTAQTREVTVNSVTVFITEYKPKPVGSRRESSEQSFSESNDSRS